MTMLHEVNGKWVCVRVGAGSWLISFFDLFCHFFVLCRRRLPFTVHDIAYCARHLFNQFTTTVSQSFIQFFTLSLAHTKALSLAVHIVACKISKLGYRTDRKREEGEGGGGGTGRRKWKMRVGHAKTMFRAQKPTGNIISCLSNGKKSLASGAKPHNRCNKTQIHSRSTTAYTQIRAAIGEGMCINVSGELGK